MGYNQPLAGHLHKIALWPDSMFWLIDRDKPILHSISNRLVKDYRISLYASQSLIGSSKK